MITVGDTVSLTLTGSDPLPGKVMHIENGEAEVRFRMAKDPNNANAHMVGVYPINDLRIYP